LDELTRRYLAQQAELGGSEVVLAGRPEKGDESRRPTATSAPQSVTSEGAGAPEVGDSPAGTPDPAAPTGAEPAAAAPTPRGRLTAAGGPRWMVGAPPIPGPGLAITSPEAVLLGNDLHVLDSLDAVAERIRTTYCCALFPNRTNAVPGEGNPQARLVLVGEGPGATEDATGRPFVGQAGTLLDSILEAIDVPRSSVYITNIVKCRPPQNRKPLPDEMAACLPYLHRQLDLIRPRVILALGGTAGEALLGVRKSLGELRGKVHTYNGIPLVVTYHPAALLRNPNWKKPTWDDVRIARQLLDR
jgi:uracil-DNA glycosylase